MLAARFESFGREGIINVNGPAEVTPTADGERITAVFTEAELKWGDIRLVDAQAHAYAALWVSQHSNGSLSGTYKDPFVHLQC